MPAYLTNDEEREIRKILDELAESLGLYSPKKESRFSGYYLDRLWFKELEGEKIPLVAFEIEKGVPGNERIRKDILNIVQTKAPRGCLITPHQRILTGATPGQGWAIWYKDHFLKAFNEYRSPFVCYCDVQVVDADSLMSSRSLKQSTVQWSP